MIKVGPSYIYHMMRGSMKQYEGFSLFNDVTNRRIRAWNRNQTSLNVLSRGGNQMLRKYLKHFNKEDLSDICGIRKEIELRGYMAVCKDVRGAVRHAQR